MESILIIKICIKICIKTIYMKHLTCDNLWPRVASMMLPKTPAAVTAAPAPGP